MKKRHLKTRLRLLKRAFRRFLSGKISRRLIFSYVGLGVLPIVVVSVFLISLTQTTVQTYIYQRNLETARRASNEIFLFIQSPLTILNTIAYTRDILEMEKFSQSRLINRIKEENSIFHKIFIVDDRGIVQVTTSFGEEQMDFSQEPFFQTAIQGKEFLSDVYFTPSRFPVLLIAEPLVRFDQVLGVLAAEIDLKNIWDLVDNITIGKTGNAFLLSNNGIVIAHKEKEKVLEKEDYSGFEFFRQLQQGLEGITHYTMDGETMIAAYAPIPKLGWGIVIQQSQQEAFTLAFQMQKRVIFFVVLTTVIAMILAYLAVQRLTSPLVELVRGVREYASGNLNHRIRLKRQDELAELAQEFNSMARSLQQNQKELQRMERLAALSRFASLVSHEIRNPLNSMNINMQILKKLINRADVPPDRKVKYLNVLSSEISRINDLVTNFLVIARPPELNLIRTDIHRVLEEVLLLQEARANAEGITIRRRYANSDITGMFDHNQLKQVFHNIVVNALEAMPNGGELTVRTEIIQRDKSSDQSQRYVRITFQDTGRGIPPEIIKEVFEFYYTTKKTGTGLGLAIAKQIIEGHQGFIYINSWPEKGTKVFIELPIDSQR
ncbi:MAG: HAMP domain-containing protein [Calditrichaeota bacterium]|nr:HAMP domain-containing protein [Calditrichota bacterium]